MTGINLTLPLLLPQPEVHVKLTLDLGSTQGPGTDCFVAPKLCYDAAGHSQN